MRNDVQAPKRADLVLLTCARAPTVAFGGPRSVQEQGPLPSASSSKTLEAGAVSDPTDPKRPCSS